MCPVLPRHALEGQNLAVAAVTAEQNVKWIVGHLTNHQTAGSADTDIDPSLINTGIYRNRFTRMRNAS
jgi:hypothetical protein